MTRLDDTLVPTAARLIEKFGVTVTFTTHTNSYDEGTGLNTRGTSTVSQKVTPRQPYGLGLVDGENIEIGDAKVYTPSGTYTPIQGDTITWTAGDVWMIMDVMPLETGLLVAAYELQVRKT